MEMVSQDAATLYVNKELWLCPKRRTGYCSYTDLDEKVVNGMEYMKNEHFALHNS